MQIADKYAPQEIEQKWYDYWERHGLFHSEPDAREPYTIVIPPPNVTGMLHMGHMLNNTLQDVLIRRARMQGKNACWVPGMDHASIATEAKVVAKLKERGIKKSSLTREKFLEYAWEWKEQYGGVILRQLRKLGASCDWDRTCFTMDDIRTEGVIKVFCDLYRKGRIYRGVRMVNWDPAASSTTCATRSREPTGRSSSPRRAPRPFWAIRRCASIPTTSATSGCRRTPAWWCRSSGARFR